MNSAQKIVIALAVILGAVMITYPPYVDVSGLGALFYGRIWQPEHLDWDAYVLPFFDGLDLLLQLSAVACVAVWVSLALRERPTSRVRSIGTLVAYAALLLLIPALLMEVLFHHTLPGLYTLAWLLASLIAFGTMVWLYTGSVTPLASERMAFGAALALTSWTFLVIAKLIATPEYYRSSPGLTDVVAGLGVAILGACFAAWRGGRQGTNLAETTY